MSYAKTPLSSWSLRLKLEQEVLTVSGLLEKSPETAGFWGVFSLPERMREAGERRAEKRKRVAEKPRDELCL